MATRDTGGQQKATRSREETDEVEASVDTEAAERRQEMSDDVDSILDEIDEVLESNAEDFVTGLRTKRGSVNDLVPYLFEPWRRSSAAIAVSDRPLTEFTKNRNSRDGYAFYCRVACAAASSREPG